MRERKTKHFNYKRVVFHERGPRLSSLLGQALSARRTVGSRRESIGPEDESPVWRVVGQYQLEPHFVFGVLMSYSPGTHPNFVIDDESATVLAVEQLVAPDTPQGVRRELLEATLYFAATDNHVVLMQSSALRAIHLERHLQWLLHDAQVLAGTNTLELTDQPPQSTRDLLQERAVREIDIGGNLMPPPAPGPAGAGAAVSQRVGTATVVGDASPESSGILLALKSLMSQDKAARLNLESLTGSNIEYTLRIRYRQDTSDDGQQLMNGLGSALRHADGVETRIKLVGGGEISGSQLRISGPVRLDTFNGTPNAQEVFEAMRQWLLDKVNSGDIAA